MKLSEKQWARTSYDGSRLEIVQHANPNSVWADGIPFIEIPEFVLSDMSKPWIIVNGEFTLKDMDESFLIDKSALSKKLKSLLNIELLYLTRHVSEAEKYSWEVQRKEAYAYSLSSTSPTPMLDGIMEFRHISKEELVGKILEKANTLNSTFGKILGSYQSIYKKIEDATKHEELPDINEFVLKVAEIKDYKLPESTIPDVIQEADVEVQPSEPDVIKPSVTPVKKSSKKTVTK